MNEKYEVLTKWKGFDNEYPGWEPLEIIYEDVPEFLERFLKTHTDKNLVKSVRTEIACLGKRGV